MVSSCFKGAEESVTKKLTQFITSTIEDSTLRRVEFVGPSVGKDLIEQGLIAMLVALCGVFVYIWLRFEWQFSISAITALLHDIIITLGLFAALQLEFSLSTVAAILTIAGYSINDTVVVFDRIRENLHKLIETKKLSYICDLSISQTLRRTLLTSITTLLALICLYWFGSAILQEFTLALIMGVVVGTYSSIYIASSLLEKVGINKQSFLPDEEEASN